jgi:hypothetical protein
MPTPTDPARRRSIEWGSRKRRRMVIALAASAAVMGFSFAAPHPSTDSVEWSAPKVARHVTWTAPSVTASSVEWS